MRTCPNCGYNNPDAAEFCLECGRVFPASSTAAGMRQQMAEIPQPLRRSRTGWQNFWLYLLGIGLGWLPLVVYLIIPSIIAFNSPRIYARYGPGLNFPVIPGGTIVFVIEMIVTVILLAIGRTRFVGYGLLTMLLLSPVVWTVSCFVLYSIHP
jgi:zinc-ribbon domain